MKLRPQIIAAFRVRHEAEAAVQALRDAGIEAEMLRYSEDFERLCLGAFPNGYDVLVDPANSERGIELLQKLWPDEPQALRRCPVCGSTDIRRVPRLAIFAVVAATLLLINVFAGQRDLFLLLIAIVGGLLAMLKPFRCNACGERLS